MGAQVAVNARTAHHLAFCFANMVSNMISGNLDLLWNPELLMWTKPKKTGIVLGVLDTSLVTAYILDILDVTHLFTFAVMTILIGGVWRVAAPDFTAKNLVVSTDQIAFAVEGIAKALNAFFVLARRIVMWDDMIATVKSIFTLQVLKVVLPCLMTYTFLIVFLTVNLVFTVPAAYNHNPELVRAKLGPHIEKLTEVKRNVIERVPRYTHVVKDM